MSIYSDLLEFKRGILGRMGRDLPGLHPTAQKAAAVDLQIIETQMLGYQNRLDLWFTRIWELQGLQLDAADRIVRHRGRDVTLTKREFQLLQFLLSIPTGTSRPLRSWVRPGRTRRFSRRRCATTSEG